MPAPPLTRSRLSPDRPGPDLDVRSGMSRPRRMAVMEPYQRQHDLLIPPATSTAPDASSSCFCGRYQRRCRATVPTSQQASPRRLKSGASPARVWASHARSTL